MIIGLTGRARAGKTEAATAIMQHAEETIQDVVLYDIGELVRKYCVSEGLLIDKPRQELIPAELGIVVYIGREMRDRFGDDFWIKQIEQKIIEEEPEVAVIPNIRYLNEAQWVQGQKEGVIVRVTALNSDGSEYIDTDRDPNHPSETQLHNFNADHYITAKRGESALVGEYAVTLYEYLRGLCG